MKKHFNILIIFILAIALYSCDKKGPNLICPEEWKAIDIYEDWVPVWCDEFEGDELDLDKWNVLDTAWGGGNNEAQYYRPANVTIEDGYLVITAHKELYGGKQYTSGRIDTKYKGDWLYGKIVVRAKLPVGRGTWPAIWMMPSMSTYGGWPRSGEIDIMEHVGYDSNRIHGTIHTAKYNHNRGTQLGNSLTVSDVETEFFDYGMEWEPGKITLFIDDCILATFAYTPVFNQDVPYHEAWPFDQAFHLIINLAIGGTWGGARGIDDSIFPTKMYVDYVRVYQKDYRYLDKKKPGPIERIDLGTEIKNFIYWSVSEDDQAIEYYEIHLDGVLHDKTRVNSYIFEGLETGKSYSVKVVAVDFSGRKSQPIRYSLQYK